MAASGGLMGRGHCVWLACVAPDAWARECATCATGRAFVVSHGMAREGVQLQDQAPWISRDEAEAAEWPDDQATDSMRSRKLRGGRLPLDSIQNSSSQSESQNRQGDYIPFPVVRAFVPDPSYVVYSYSPYRQPLHIVYPASTYLSFIVRAG